MKCIQEKYKCLFYRDGKCDILSDTHFKRPCPFYKERPNEVIADKFFDGVLFRTVKGYDNKYYVSESGKVVNHMGKELKAGFMRDRLYVQLKDDLTLKTQRKSVAVIVADAFIPGTGQVGYLDGDPKNCERWNLYRIGE